MLNIHWNGRQTIVTLIIKILLCIPISLSQNFQLLKWLTRTYLLGPQLYLYLYLLFSISVHFVQPYWPPCSFTHVKQIPLSGPLHFAVLPPEDVPTLFNFWPHFLSPVDLYANTFFSVIIYQFKIATDCPPSPHKLCLAWHPALLSYTITLISRIYARYFSYLLIFIYLTFPEYDLREKKTFVWFFAVLYIVPGNCAWTINICWMESFLVLKENQVNVNDENGDNCT